MATTFALIRAGMVAAIRDLTPGTATEYDFALAPRSVLYRQWIAKAPVDTAVRRYIIERTGSFTDPERFDPAERDITVEATLTMAYPVALGLYGIEDFDSLEDVIEADQHQIRDALTASDHYVSGQYAAEVTVDAPDRGDDKVWFATLSVLLRFAKSQSL
jgi:hypothetical protein